MSLASHAARRASAGPTRLAATAALVAALAWLALAAAAPTPSAAQGRAKFGVQLKVGTSFPIEDYVENKTILIDNYPYISDISNDTGGSFTLLIYLRDLEFSLGVHFLPWGDAELLYRGDAPARAIDESRIDDAGVFYVPYEPLPEDTFSNPYNGRVISSGSLVIVTLDGGYRYYLLRRSFFETYIPITGGPGWARVTAASGYNFGVHAATGIGFDILLGQFVFVFDTRVHTLITESAVGATEGSANAITTNSTFGVVDALISTTSFATFDVGLRYNFD